METPRYVKVKSGFFMEKEEIGKVYDTNEPFPSHLTHCGDLTWSKVWDRESNRKHFHVHNPDLIINSYPMY